MHIAAAQREVRTAYYGGFVGQFVAGGIWALAAAVGTWGAAGYAMAVLFFLSMALFPLTQVILRAMGRPARLSPGNSFDHLAIQVAFTVPIGFILVGAATLSVQHWFFPAAMVVVGAHYLPFVFLYGMRHFALLAGLLIVGGALLGVYGPPVFGFVVCRGDVCGLPGSNGADKTTLARDLPVPLGRHRAVVSTAAGIGASAPGPTHRGLRPMLKRGDPT